MSNDHTTTTTTGYGLSQTKTETSSPYHLSTIGIDSVFASVNYHSLEDPPGQEDPTNVLTQKNRTILTTLQEITGVLKSCPEDFIVREIGGGVDRTISSSSSHPHNKGEGKEGQRRTRTADLTDSWTLPPSDTCNASDNDSSAVSTDVQLLHPPAGQNCNEDTYSNHCSNCSDSLVSTTSPTADRIPVPIVSAADTPQDAVKIILTTCIQQTNDQEPSICEGNKLYERLETLSNKAMSFLLQDGEENATKNIGSCPEEEVIIPPIMDDAVIVRYQNLITGHDIPSTRTNGKKSVAQNRCTFHRTLKLAFPLLKSCTLSVQESDAKNDADESRFVKVGMDDAFFGLVRYLLYPQRDIPLLYEFRNRGCNGPDAVHGHIMERKKRNQEDIPRIKEHPSATAREVHLFLKPSIQREERKNIHHLISKAYRDFDTGTKNDVAYDSVDKDKRTTIIIVKWSRHALKNNMMRKKRKMAKDSKIDKCHTMCILKKRRQEHSSVLSLLASALKCRQSDIGLAGRKDTMAVTYQYCTLRHISPFRARRANEYLKEKGIELGDFQRVSWLLNPGDLQGNHFEIIVRNVKRVEKVFDKSDGSTFQERLVPCESHYLVSAVERVRRGGFVNFFGEQRVGEAGPADEVGVRSSDVGRAMLKGDFAGAIDLLMRGRNKSRSGDFVESEEVRLMRKTYFETGDIDKTLSLMPRNSYLGRERTLLQGLKRYGRDKPLEVLKCLNYSTRMLYINAYQALVWNKMASERIKRYGSKPIPGDLYMEDDSDEVKIVVDKAIVDIRQVVLPLPGYNVLYPENIIGDMYQETMNQDGVKFEKDAVPEATGKGSYRSLVTFSEFLEWENVSERDPVTDIKFNFSLRSGSYATMCLRELMATTVLRTSEEGVENISQ